MTRAFTTPRALPRTWVNQKKYWYFRHPKSPVIKLRGAPFSAEWLEHYYFLMAEMGEEVSPAHVSHVFDCLQSTWQPACFVYFIGWENGPIKIGIARNIAKRIADLQSACPYRLVVYAATPGTQLHERKYHAKFADYRLEGEWFERCAEILSEIDKINFEQSLDPTKRLSA